MKWIHLRGSPEALDLKMNEILQMLWKGQWLMGTAATDWQRLTVTSACVCWAWWTRVSAAAGLITAAQLIKLVRACHQVQRSAHSAHPELHTVRRQRLCFWRQLMNFNQHRYGVASALISEIPFYRVITEDLSWWRNSEKWWSHCRAWPSSYSLSFI